MKRNGMLVIALALAAVLCTGCGVKEEELKSDPLVNEDGTAPVGNTLLVKSSARTATRNKRTWRLSANGSS